MADVKISALPAATTPLAGTEVLPIVQSSTTKKVAISDVTAGRAISASSLTLTTPLAVGSGGTGLSTLTSGYIPFGAGTSAFGNSANLFWDNTNKRLGIGTASPLSTVHISAAGPVLRIADTTASGGVAFIGTDTTGLYFRTFTADTTRFLNAAGTANLTIDTIGNLSVGTTASGFNGQGAPLFVGSGSGSTGMTIYSGATGYGTIQFAKANTSGSDSYRGVVSYNHASDFMYFSTAATERMRIDSSGNVGVGATNPSSFGKLTVAGTIVANTNTFVVGTLGATLGYYTSGLYPVSYVQMPPSGGFQIWDSTTAAKLVLDTSGNLGIGISSPSTRLHVAGGNIQLDNNQAVQWGGGTNYIYGNNSTNILVFATNNTERARIDASGNLLVGTTNSSVTAGDGFKYIASTNQVSHVISAAGNTYLLYNTTAGAYRFFVSDAGVINATSTTITGISDRRLKENIVDLDVGLDALLALKPRKFDWKSGKGKDIKGDRGWIADEFQQVFPDLIEDWLDAPPEGEEPYKAVRPDLIPVLVKAIQELAAKVQALEAKVA